MDRTKKDYTQPYSTPYYEELKRNGIRLPCFLTHIRTDTARIEKPKDARMFRMMFLTPRIDGCCGTIDTSSQTNLIMTDNNMETTLTYHPQPTKEDLLKYFSQRIRVRKMTPKEALRLMDFSEESIDKMMNAEIKTTLKNCTVKVKKMPKTQLYKQAGNSIVVSCIYHIGRTLWIPNQLENQPAKDNWVLPLFN